jgi:hypothetical protein
VSLCAFAALKRDLKSDMLIDDSRVDCISQMARDMVLSIYSARLSVAMWAAEVERYKSQARAKV